MADHQVTIDLITEMPDGSWVLVLIEQGPWAEVELHANLQRVQERLYNCVDVAIDGHLAKLYPESKGKAAVVRLDAYDTPDTPVRDFVGQFANHVRNTAQIQWDLNANGFVTSLHFEYRWCTLQKAG
ncbi:MAG TPA: hypothetical protein VF595_05105 [Tepidisphaeraceae bacterium]|jgi:hypothetical protein